MMRLMAAGCIMLILMSAGKQHANKCECDLSEAIPSARGMTLPMLYDQASQPAPQQRGGRRNFTDQAGHCGQPHQVIAAGNHDNLRYRTNLWSTIMPSQPKEAPSKYSGGSQLGSVGAKATETAITDGPASQRYPCGVEIKVNGCVVARHSRGHPVKSLTNLASHCICHDAICRQRRLKTNGGVEGATTTNEEDSAHRAEDRGIAGRGGEEGESADSATPLETEQRIETEQRTETEQRQHEWHEVALPKPDEA